MENKKIMIIGNNLKGINKKWLDIGLRSGGLTLNDVWLVECNENLLEKIATAQPKLLVLLGRETIKILLPECDTIPIRELRGDIFEVENLPMMVVTYHPSSGLKNLKVKTLLLIDLKKLGKIRGSL